MSTRLPEQTIREKLWTSTEVAQALRTGVSSVKRWSDAGALRSVRTIGGHRRYRLEEIHRFAREHALPIDALPPLENARTIGEIRDIIRGELEPDAITVAIRQALRTVDDRASALDELGETMGWVGDQWSEGSLGVEHEHRTSHAVVAALEQVRPVEREDGPIALLACPPHERHDLPLHMVRLMLEWNGWRTDFLGADLPWKNLRAAADASHPAAVLLSSRDAEAFRSAEFRAFVRWCRRRKIVVGIGGSWARGGTRRPEGIIRFRSMRGLEVWLRRRENRELQ